MAVEQQVVGATTHSSQVSHPVTHPVVQQSPMAVGQPVVDTAAPSLQMGHPSSIEASATQPMPVGSVGPPTLSSHMGHPLTPPIGQPVVETATHSSEVDHPVIPPVVQQSLVAVGQPVVKTATHSSVQAVPMETLQVAKEGDATNEKDLVKDGSAEQPLSLRLLEDFLAMEDSRKEAKKKQQQAAKASTCVSSGRPTKCVPDDQHTECVSVDRHTEGVVEGRGTDERVEGDAEEAPKEKKDDVGDKATKAKLCHEHTRSTFRVRFGTQSKGFSYGSSKPMETARREAMEFMETFNIA